MACTACNCVCKEEVEGYASLEKIIQNHWDLNYRSQENLSKRINEIKNEVDKHIEWLDLYRKGRVNCDKEFRKLLDECIGEIGELKRKKAQADLVANHYIEVNKRLDKLESENKMRQDTIACVDRDYDEATVNLENRMNKIEKDIERKLDVDYEKWVQYFNEVHPKKSPHKCPICNGLGKELALIAQQVKICNACEGKGIVWG